MRNLSCSEENEENKKERVKEKAKRYKITKTILWSINIYYYMII
jgi:hypothetical protein